MQKIKTKFLAILTGFALLFSSSAAVFANSDFEPYQETFIISAYYSPLPDQSFYFRGDYSAEIRMNGNGTNGADGTQVYPGMLAAPKTYSFGTKLKIPGLGVGVIHDRGGAIVFKGERGFKHDRLDVWMGKGEEGLARALSWGVRTVTATVYPASHTITESFTLPNMGSTFTVDLAPGDTGNLVSRLQEELKTYGYFRENISGVFDENTQKALLGFQLARNIVANADSAGAGILGPQTREKLNGEIFSRNWQPPTRTNNFLSNSSSSSTSSTNSRFPVTLSLGDKGDRVREMQIALTNTGHYGCEINGIYDEAMESCVFRFQEEQSIVSSLDEHGAGYFGEQTRAKLASLLDERNQELNNLIADKLPSGTIQPGGTGDVVSKLQEGLQTLGYFKNRINGNYDDATTFALAEFQVAEKVVESETSYGAGFFGPKTQIAFEKSFKRQLLALPSLPVNPDWNRAVWANYTPEFKTSLALGDVSDEVAELQEVLKELEYFDSEITGNFGGLTEKAVIDFQIANGVIDSAAEYGAGTFGPMTRTALQVVIAEKKIVLQKKEEAQS